MFLQLQRFICGRWLVFLLVPGAGRQLSARACGKSQKCVRLQQPKQRRMKASTKTTYAGTRRDGACGGLQRPSQPGSNKLSLRVGWSSVIAQVDVLHAVFNRRVWWWRLFSSSPAACCHVKGK